MRIKLIYSLLLTLAPLWLLAQNPNGNYNPYVNSGTVSPSPIWPVEANGKGTIRFNIGNTGSDPLEVFGDQHIILTLTLSYGDPDHTDPTLAVGGTAAELFSWRFNNNTFSAEQISEIPAGYEGSIEIEYRVTNNSASPGLNGFNVNIAPAAYQTESNSQEDDAVSYYTYTEVRDYGDAPSSYGTAWHIIDYKNYLGSLVDGEQEALFSARADGDDLDNEADEDGIVFPAQMQQGESVSIAVTITGVGYLSGWIDWNADGDFADAGEQVADNVEFFAGTHDLMVNVPADAVIYTSLFARFRFSHETILGSEGGGNEGEVEDYMITISASPNAPSVPGNLQAEHNSQDVVALSWSASTDDVGVEGYTIYRDNTELAITPGINYSDNTVETGNSYTYTVSAFDADGFESERSPGITVEVLDITAPSIPGNLAVISQTENSVTLGWNASTDNIGVAGYNIYRDIELLNSTFDIAYTDSTIVSGNTYEYSVSAYDASGNESAQTEPVTITLSSTNFAMAYQLLIHPNPSRGEFILSLAGTRGEFIIEIISPVGNIILQKIIQVDEQLPEVRISSQDLSPGIYNIRVYREDSIFFGKLMIIH